MYLAQAVEYSVQTGGGPRIPFEWRFRLTGFRASKSGINYRILSIVAVNAALLLVATRPSIAVPGFGGTSVAGAIASTSEPTVFSCAKTGHKCGEGCQGLRFFLTEVSGEPLIVDIMLKGRQGLGVRTVDNLVLFS